MYHNIIISYILYVYICMMITKCHQSTLKQTHASRAGCSVAPACCWSKNLIWLVIAARQHVTTAAVVILSHSICCIISCVTWCGTKLRPIIPYVCFLLRAVLLRCFIPYEACLRSILRVYTGLVLCFITAEFKLGRGSIDVFPVPSVYRTAYSSTAVPLPESSQKLTGSKTNGPHLTKEPVCIWPLFFG